MTTDSRINLPRYLALLRIIAKLDNPKTSAKARKDAAEALATYEEPAHAAGYVDARAWCKAGPRPAQAAIDAGRRYAAANGLA